MDSKLKQSSLLTMVTILAALAVTLRPSSASEREPVAESKPNIIFILADDQGWNGTSVQMHPDISSSKSDFYRTPNLEKLAASGLSFSHAYAPGPMCSPTRASLQTGKSPAQLRMTNVGRSRPAIPSQRLALPAHSSTLSTTEITIGETLKSAGYATAWFGKWHLGGEGPGAHGYDSHDGPTGNNDGNSKDPENPKDIFGITERGIAFMEKNVKANQPFYLQLWHYAVHSPVQSKSQTTATYSRQTKGKTHSSIPFAGMTTDLDSGVGMILAKVKELGISENTYIVYMSDHGAGRNLSSNAPLTMGKGTLWEGGIRVPLIIGGPGVASGKFCSTPTVGWDLFPTFCQLAGVSNQLPAGIEGVSLTPLFESGVLMEENKAARSIQERDSIAFHFPHYGNIGATSAPHSTITIDGFKLIKFYEQNQIQLFDLSKDISETTDLSKTMPEKARLLDRRLKEYLESIDAAIPSNNPNYDPAAEPASGRGTRGSNRSGTGGPSAAARQSRLEERLKELASLESATKAKDFQKLGALVSSMKKSIASDATSANRENPRAARARIQRETEANQLEVACQNRDIEQLSQILRQIRKRLESRSSGRRPRGRTGARAGNK
ncbi:MAG: sulfatase-like hydrolase/transferase [Mariniblastus sp.]|nr:sulfatase-like hydrolase/transferase [Mariniblastus sp.]